MANNHIQTFIAREQAVYNRLWNMMPISKRMLAGIIFSPEEYTSRKEIQICRWKETKIRGFPERQDGVLSLSRK